MRPDEVFARYQDLQAYVGWTSADAERVRLVGPLIKASFPALIDDFYLEIDRHPMARSVITGGAEQIARLKKSLHAWLEELFAGVYDESYVHRRAKAGQRHVEIGLKQIYTNAALSRLHNGLLQALAKAWPHSLGELALAQESLQRLIDLDLAMIGDSYQTEFMRRQQQSDRLAAIGQVAGGIAHELRNPLNVIQTSVYYLLNVSQLSPEKLDDHLHRIERQVGLANRVITALTDFARLPIPLMRVVDIANCMQEILETTMLPQSIAVAIDIAPDAVILRGDTEQLKIVFGNLIRNAGDAMPNGGQLNIRTRRKDSSYVEIDVADTGFGIRADDLERIMEPLYSTKTRGIGLGLAITRAIVDKHGGQLRVTSELGRGTLFKVTLPTTTESSA